jgi:hypothetical protein
LQETNSNWSQIQDECYSFDSKEKKIAAMNAVTVEQVNAKIESVFFKDVRRINLKTTAETQTVDEEAVQKNTEFYKDL